MRTTQKLTRLQRTLNVQILTEKSKRKLFKAAHPPDFSDVFGEPGLSPQDLLDQGGPLKFHKFNFIGTSRFLSM